MKRILLRTLLFFSFLFMFISFLNIYLELDLWDYDFWWHITNGRYIAENGSIPDTDLFSFVSNLEENEDVTPLRTKAILHQYWLAQLLFYKIYYMFGEKGIIILRSLLLLATVLLVFWWLRREKVRFYLIYPLVFSVFLASMSFRGERPVLFTLLFCGVAFVLLDSYKKERKRSFLFFLPPLMMLWSNLHGGYVLGNVFIAVYIFGEAVNYFFLRKGEKSGQYMATLCIAGTVAIAASGINPGGFSALIAVLNSSRHEVFLKHTQEYLSLFTLYSSKARSVDWGFIVLIALFPILVIVRNKKFDLVYVILLAGLCYQAVTALRYMIYYVLIAAMLLGRELNSVLDDHLKNSSQKRAKFEIVTAFLMLISSILFVSGYLDIGKITFKKADRITVPEAAVDFIQAQNIEGNIFNDMGYGGYLSWRLYPPRKVFIDTRQLNATVLTEYGWIMRSVASIKNKELPEGRKPLWQRLLDHYEIDVVIFDHMDVHGTVKPLIFELLQNEEWAPVYHDLITVVFLRDKGENKRVIEKYRLDETEVCDGMIIRFTQWAMMSKSNPSYLISLGDVFFHLKRYDDAMESYQYALGRLPQEGSRKYIEGKMEMIGAIYGQNDEVGRNRI